MFSGRHAIELDDTGSVYIDKDPEVFEWVIRYLRDGCQVTIDQHHQFYYKFLKELSYWLLFTESSLG